MLQTKLFKGTVWRDGFGFWGLKWPVLGLTWGRDQFKFFRCSIDFITQKAYFSWLKVPSGQIGSAWEWYHWIGLKKSSTATDFDFLILIFEYLKKLQSSEPLQTKMNPTSHACLDLGLYAHKPRSISAKLCSKNAGKSTIDLWIPVREYRIFEEFQHPAIQTKIVQYLRRIFPSK